MPMILEASTANVQIAVTAGLCLGWNQFAATLAGEFVMKQFPIALMNYPISTK